MSVQNLSNYDPILKEWYAPMVKDTLNNTVRLFDYIEQDADPTNWSGNKVIQPQRITRNVGVGSRADGGSLPTSGRQGYLEQQVSAKYNYGRIQVTLPTMVASRNDRGAFERALDSEMKGLAKDFRNDINRQLYGLHKLCDVNATVSTTNVFTAKDSYDANVGTDDKALRFLKPGMLLDLYQGGSAVDTDITVSSINKTTNVVTVGSTYTFTAADNLYVAGSAGGASEIEGLLDAISTSRSYQNIDSATYTTWDSNVLANGGTARAITDDLLQRGVDDMDEANSGDLKLVISHHSVRREYLKTLVPDKRFASTALRGGHKALDFNGVPFEFDKDAPFRKVFLLDTDTWKYYIQADLQWADNDGSVLSRVSDKPEFEAFLYLFSNLACEAPAANARVDDINATE